ncbi:spore germination protein KA [Aneurinibacillus soli]|uniref:Spore germination protein B1 n=1 Tax=Aneurinibacillus soli TaxID=1500254 RepID=A0A0U4WBW3_9BACL|nr:spore germination protein [Aneurinibacillus soli]PYE61250.1 spore germination protein KA [Aneurinibacillus soli]BAU26315.1 Spore germination protein B1 [Aneurinibacillus soli]
MMDFLKKLISNNRTEKRPDIKINVSPSLQKNKEYIQNQMFHSSDLKWRSIRFNQVEGLIVFFESLSDQQRIQKEIIRPLEENKEGTVDEIITSVEIARKSDLSQLPQTLVQGNCVLLFEGTAEAFIVGVVADYKRGILEPVNEGVIRGAHDGFIENLITNLYLVRKRIENPDLVVRYYQVGKATKTKLALLYMQDLANPELVKEVDHRLGSIVMDTTISPGFIAELIEDNPFSLFPQILFTERPDRAVAHLMEGRVVILSDGDPSALILPVTFFAFFQSPDDYHSRWIVGSLVRFIRLMSFIVASLVPALYIAVIGFHPEILPSNLIYTVKSSIDRVPFPPIVEAFLMQIALEVLREAGVRLPSRVGQTIGFVGGLVIGESVVRAGLISYPMVIVVALTAISSFVAPSNEISTTTRILGFPLMILASMFGLFGIMYGLLFILIHLCKLESFGTAYFAPVMPLRIKDLKDTFIRFPIWSLNQRPHDPHAKRLNQERYSRGWEQDEPGKE